MTAPRPPWFRFARGDSPGDLDADRTDDDDDRDEIEPESTSIYDAPAAFSPDRNPLRKQNNRHG